MWRSDIGRVLIFYQISHALIVILPSVVRTLEYWTISERITSAGPIIVVDQLKTSSYVVHAFLEATVLWLLVQVQWLSHNFDHYNS